MNKMDIIPCRYKRFCKRSSAGCYANDEHWCEDAIKFYKKLCPLMVVANYPEQNCSCDILEIRKLWPNNKRCFENDDCLPRRHKTVRQQVGKKIDAPTIVAAFSAI